MIYEKSNLKIIGDFAVKEIQKDEYNVDLIIEVEYRCVNLYFENLPKYIKSRIQFPSVKSIFIRFCNIEDNNICTVHFLSDSGIYSTMANFEIDYSEIYIEVTDKEFFVELKIHK
ncbi:hypothetical protein KPL35_13345 [Clostridium sp. CF011]|uniref:hypothetical protein n=1 Tax=Clostridium sp. CF011 TaxID=2843318 RepID=UPI001C0D30A7|nr:hypothetical protein [Clostridium sp. CF011]MBU3093055.1 hypothetical protein [Clostridium sp. CF011]WAG69110.1 hypothetical protein LL036_13925 [Clostridium sp. CF011]